MNWDAINEIIQRHGGAVSPPVVVDALIDNPDPIDRRLNPKIENPTPTYRYNLKDGKYFTAKANAAGPQTGQEGPGEATFQIVDPGNAVQPLTPADRLPSAAQDLVKLDAGGNVIDAQGNITLPDGTKKPATAAKLRDPSTGLVTDLPDAAAVKAGAPTTKTINGVTYQYNPTTNDWDKTNLPVETKETKDQGPTAAGGARWIPDPSNPTNEIEVVTILSPDGTPTNKPTGASRKAPATAPTAASNVIWQDIPNQPGKQQGGTIVDGKFQPITELVKDKDKKPVAVYGTGANDKFRITLDDEGKVVSQVPNDNYVGEKPTQLTPDLVAPNIPLLKGDGTVQWVPNQNRVPANQAMLDLLDQAHVKVNGGSMSMADAKDLLTGAVNTMNAQTAQTNAATSQLNAQTAQQQNIASAANDILTNARGNAQTGAGMLNQRVQSATGALTSLVNAAAGSKMTSVPAGLGQQLVGGLQDWVTGLGGGDVTYDAAARMVQAADPKISNDPSLAGTATATLKQMFDLYQAQSGQPHPIVQATQAAQQSQQSGGMVAPQTGGYNPNDIQWNQPPQNAPGRVMGPGGVITGPGVPAVQAVAPIQPVPVASGFTAPVAQVPGQNYGAGVAYTGGIAPWLAQPQAAFMAPPMPPPLTVASVLGRR